MIQWLSRRFAISSPLACVCICLAAVSSFAGGVPRAECFPIDKLPPNLRAKAETLLLKALDSEALFTFVGDLKPMSSGFASFKFSADKPAAAALASLEEMRELLSVWQCGGEFFAGVHHFAKIYQGERYADAVIIRKPLMARVIAAHAAFFNSFGVTANAHPLEALLAVEYSPQNIRLRHYGHLFGYPDYAVDFFVAAAESQERNGMFVNRDFYRIPTYEMPEGRSPFVYAVPVGHEENDADRTIKLRAEEILTNYRERRTRYIGEGKPGVLLLLRDWFDDSKGLCSPANARFSNTPAAKKAAPGR